MRPVCVRLLVLVTGLLAAIPTAAGAVPPMPLPLHVGAVFSQTGAGAAYGTSQVNGAQLAIDEVNQLSGQFPLMTLDLRDDASDPTKAKAAFTSLIGSGSIALLGPTLSGSALAADPVAQQASVPVLGVSNTIDGITEMGPYVFRNSLPESVVQPQTVKVAKKRLHLKRVAIVWASPDTYSSASNKVFKKALKKNHVKVTVDRSFRSTSSASLRRALDAAAKTKPDALVVSALQADAVKAIVAARKRKALKKVPLIGGNALNSPTLYAQTKGAAQGAISGTAWLAGRPGYGSAGFVKAYTARYHVAPDQFAAQAYAGVLLLAVAHLRATALTGPAVRNALAAIRNQGTILGTFSFDAHREPQYHPVVVQLRKGKQVAIG